MVTHRNVESFESATPGPTADQARLASDQWRGNQTSFDSTGGGGQTTQATELGVNYQQVFGHLQNADYIMDRQGARAALPEFGAAIRAADSIDQSAVNQEAAYVQQLLQQGGLDAQTQRQLNQELANLDALHRAPGIARANLGLFLLRNGQNQEGLQLLKDASQRDPEMAADPNFQRHLMHVLQIGRALQSQLGQGDNGAPSNQGDIQNQLQGDTGTQANPGGSSTGGAPTWARGGDNTSAPSPQQSDAPRTQQNQLSPTTEGLSPYEFAQKLAGTVVPGQQISQDQVSTLVKNFKTLEAAADQGVSPSLQGAADAFKQAVHRYQADFAPKKNALEAIDTQAALAIKNSGLTGDNLQKAIQTFDAMGTSVNAAQYQAYERQLVALVPATANFLTQRDQLLGANVLQEAFNVNATKDKFYAEENQSAMVRFQFANALTALGDTAQAKTVMADAIAHNKLEQLPAELAIGAAVLGITQADVTQAQQNMQAAASDNGSSAGATTGSDGGNGPSRTTLGGARATSDAANMSAPSSDLIGTDQDPATQQLRAAVTAYNTAGDAQKGLQASDAQFQNTVTLADRELASLPTLDALGAQIAKIMPADKQKQDDEITTQINQLGAKLSPQETSTLQDLLAGKLNESQAKQFAQDHAQLIKLIQQHNELIKDAQPILEKVDQVKAAISNRMQAHLTYAEVLQAAGQTDQAKRVLAGGWQGLSPDLQAALQQGNDVKTLATALGMTGGGGSSAPGSDTTGTQKAGSSGTTDGGTSQQPQQVNADVKPTGDATVDKLIKTNDIDSLYAQAISSSHQGLDKSAPYWKAAAAVADSVSADTMRQQLQSDLATLKNPQSDAQAKLQAYGDAMGTVMAGGIAAVKIHSNYADQLTGFHRFADAQQQLEAAVKASDTLPINEMKQLKDLMRTDMANQQLPKETRDKLTEAFAELDKATQLPIETRKQAAQFYLAGGKTPDGQVFGQAIVAGFDKDGKPLAQGADTKILKPKEASDMINQAAALEQTINGVDVNKTPDKELTTLKDAVLANAPDNLKKELEQSGHGWADTGSTLVSTTLGIAATIGVLALTKGEGAGALGKLDGLAGAMRIGTAGTLAGMTTSIGSNYAMEKLAFGRKDWTLGDSAELGGGGLLAAGAMIGMHKAALGYKFGQLGQAEATNDLMLQGFAKMTGKAADKVTLGDVMMRYEGASAEIRGSVDTMLRGIKDQKMTLADLAATDKYGAQAKTVIKALGNDKLTIAQADQLTKGLGLKATESMNSIVSKYGEEGARRTNLSWLYRNADKETVENFYGTNNVQRGAATYKILTKETHGLELGNQGLQAVPSQGNWLTSRARSFGNGVTSVFKPLAADRVATGLQFNAATIGAGTLSALTYNVGSTWTTADVAHRKGDSTETANSVLANSFKFSSDLKQDMGNIILQSAFTGGFMGGGLGIGIGTGITKPSATLWRTPAALWTVERAGAEAGFASGAKSAGSTAWQSLMMAKDAIPDLTNQYSNTLWGLARPALAMPTFYGTLPKAIAGHSNSDTAAQPWREALANQDRPIQNEEGYTVNPNTGLIEGPSDKPQQKSKDQTDLPAPPKQSGNSSGQSNGEAKAGDDPNLPSDITGNIK